MQDKAISEEQMVQAFLVSELSSSRFSSRLHERMQELGCDEQIIRCPDFSKETENSLRADLLEYRGYITRSEGSLFSGFPYDVAWRIEKYSVQHLLENALYINDQSYWHTFSGGTRRPRDAARLFVQPLEIVQMTVEHLYRKCPQNLQRDYHAFAHIAHLIDQGRCNELPKMIFVSDGHKLVNLEGHGRLTGFAMTKRGVFPAVEVIIGYSDNLNKWIYF